jgi:hypothetical protein
MEELLLRLQKRLENLVDRHAQLEQANEHLDKTKSVLIQENKLLSIKQQKAIEQVRNLLARLKAIET